MTSLPLLCPPPATSSPFCLHSTPSTSTLLQLLSMPAQLMQLCHAHSHTNHGSTPDLFRPGSHAKGCCVRAHLRPGTCYILVLMELRRICGTDTQGDKSLLDAWAEMRRKLSSHSARVWLYIMGRQHRERS